MASQKCHEPGNEAVSRPFKHVEKGGQKRCSNEEHERAALQQVGDEQGRCRLVEPVFFLQYKRLVYREQCANEGQGQKQYPGKRERLCDLVSMSTQDRLVERRHGAHLVLAVVAKP